MPKKLKDNPRLSDAFQSLAPTANIPNVDVVILKPDRKKNGLSRQRLTNYDHKTKTIFHLPGNNSQKKETSLKKVMRVLAVKNGVRLPGTKKPRISPATQLKQRSDEITKQIHDGTSTVNPVFQKMVLHLEKQREERKAKQPKPKRSTSKKKQDAFINQQLSFFE